MIDRVEPLHAPENWPRWFAPFYIAVACAPLVAIGTVLWFLIG